MQVTGHLTCDQLLWKALLGGDRDAFASLYEVYFDLLYEYGMRSCNNAELVKDCIQDLFVKLWTNRVNLSATTAIKPYLFTALRHAILNKQTQVRRVKYREGKAVQGFVFDMNYSIDELIIRNEDVDERKAQILKALEQLTPRQKECIYLRFYADLEYTEIAGIMQISIKAAYKIVGRAIGFLRVHLKEAAIDLVWLIPFCLAAIPM